MTVHSEESKLTSKIVWAALRWLNWLIAGMAFAVFMTLYKDTPDTGPIDLEMLWYVASALCGGWFWHANGKL